jgi:hypothetical protein
MLRNVTINTSVGPLVGVAAENGVVYVNGTPHALTMYGYDKQTVLCVIPLSGTVVRVPDEYQPLPETFPGIPETLNINHPDQCVGLPDPIPGMFIIVSRVAAEALKIYHRPDIRVPGEPIRDRTGIQIGAVGISHYV